MSRLTKILRWSVWAVCAAAITIVCGFIWFVQSIEHSDLSSISKADGIVAFTGGVSRLSEADKLLESGHGKRLLITGVYEATTRDELKRLMPLSLAKFDCCVDIDRKALNTIGNAVETSKWVRGNRFSSIIVVTSSYHMPRSLTELRCAMPDVKLISYPVIPPNFHIEGWWRYPGTARILISEYVKLILALARLGAAHVSSGVMTGASVQTALEKPQPTNLPR